MDMWLVSHPVTEQTKILQNHGIICCGKKTDKKKCKTRTQSTNAHTVPNYVTLLHNTNSKALTLKSTVMDQSALGNKGLVKTTGLGQNLQAFAYIC